MMSEFAAVAMNDTAVEKCRVSQSLHVRRCKEDFGTMGVARIATRPRG